MVRDSESPTVNRRNVLKATAATGLLGGGTVGAVASSGLTRIPINGEEYEPPNPDVERTEVDRSVKRAVPHWDMLTLPADTIQRYIQRSDYSADKKTEAVAALNELRRRYPIRREKDGNVTRLTLATDRGQSREDFELSRTAHRAFADGTSFGGGHSHWNVDHHEKMAAAACDEFDLDSGPKSDIVDGSDNPDDWNVEIKVPDSIPHRSTVKDGLETGLNYLLRYYGQYFDPGVFEVYHWDNHDIDFGELGGAPDAADLELYYANYYNSDVRLGRATHYFADMGVPLHTSMGWEQVNLEIYTKDDGTIDWRIDPMYWLHGEYEDYVQANWLDGEYFKYNFTDDCTGGVCYMQIDDTKQKIKDVADFTEDYSYDTYHKILDEGDVGWTNWSSSTKDWMRDTTENCLDKMGDYFRGVIAEQH